ncbi:MAG: cytochrome c-type biogenesis protein [Ilumatobacteraceae bacterium]
MTGRIDRRGLNRRLKSWPSWIVLAFTVVLLMAIGLQRGSGPATPQERVESISRQLACPTCDGESVAESRGTASQSIRQEIVRLVGEGQLNDSQIVQTIDDRFGEELKLTPDATGLESLVWALPIAVAVTAVIGLALVFRRWRTIEDRSADADDRELVARALADESRATDAQS